AQKARGLGAGCACIATFTCGHGACAPEAPAGCNNQFTSARLSVANLMLWLVGTDDIKRLIDSRPWSNAQLRRLGDGIRAGEAPGANAPSYNAVIAWYQELTMLVRQRIASEDWYQFIRRRQLA